jgi:hypothetical protein
MAFPPGYLPPHDLYRRRTRAIDILELVTTAAPQRESVGPRDGIVAEGTY